MALLKNIINNQNFLDLGTLGYVLKNLMFNLYAKRVTKAHFLHCFEKKLKIDVMRLTSNRSDDEVLELGTVLVGLSAEDVSEDSNNEVVGVVLGVLEDGVNEEEFNSDILEAV